MERHFQKWADDTGHSVKDIAATVAARRQLAGGKRTAASPWRQAVTRADKLQFNISDPEVATEVSFLLAQHHNCAESETIGLGIGTIKGTECRAERISVRLATLNAVFSRYRTGRILITRFAVIFG